MSVSYIINLYILNPTAHKSPLTRVAGVRDLELLRRDVVVVPDQWIKPYALHLAHVDPRDGRIQRGTALLLGQDGRHLISLCAGGINAPNFAGGLVKYLGYRRCSC